MAYREPILTGTANQITVTQTSGGQTVSIAAPMIIATQPCFSVKCSGDITDVTGDGTTYALVCDTKIFDQATNYSTGTGIFTAPVTGKYLFQINITLAGLLVGHTSCLITLVTTSTTFTGIEVNPFAAGANGGVLSSSFSCIASMSANDTAQPNITVSGGTKVVDISAGTINTFWSGALIC